MLWTAWSPFLNSSVEVFRGDNVIIDVPVRSNLSWPFTLLFTGLFVFIINIRSDIVEPCFSDLFYSVKVRSRVIVPKTPLFTSIIVQFTTWHVILPELMVVMFSMWFICHYWHIVVYIARTCTRIQPYVRLPDAVCRTPCSQSPVIINC